MNRDAYTLITTSSPRPATVHVADLGPGPDHTLLYGYTCDRESWHVYLENDMINWVKYWDLGESGELINSGSADTWVAEELVPNKRVYPEFTDYAFACDLRDAGVEVSYRRFSEERYQLSRTRRFHGMRLSDFDAQ